jgi:DNA polymerase-3 subunit epsilon/ATP-dependent DNA helicase DinG
VLLWLPTSVSGDGDELFLPTPQERGVWGRLSADNPTCTSEKCASFGGGGCFFHNARQEAEAAHVLIVNHALLLADVAAENRVLPDYRYLVIDEAHHLEAATTEQLSFSISRYDLRRSFDELASSQRAQGHGLLEDIVGRVRYAAPENIAARMQAVVEQTLEAIQETDFFAKEFFDQTTEVIKRQIGAVSDYVQRVRITSALRTQPAWSNIEIAWDNLGAQVHEVVDKLNRVAGALGELEEYDIPDYEDVLGRLLSATRVLAQALQHTTAIVSQPSGDGIYWAELQTRDNSPNAPRVLSLHSAPLHVGPLIEKHLLKTKNSVVMTSATLRIARSFDFVQGRLNAQDVNTLAVGSPFDYKSSTLVYVVTDVPEPNMQGYQKAVDAGLIELCAAMGGRTLALFTSYSQLRASSRSLGPALLRHDIHVYEQSSGLSRRQLLEQFKNSARGVLLGTRSFWEGVDVPGEALSCLAITRLPFSVPTDPIFAARSETFEHAFMEYSVPDAVLRFRQGFGRLIRTRSDRGVVVIFDKRVVSKRYGRTFIESLPDCTVRQGGTREIAQAVRAWMQRAV